MKNSIEGNRRRLRKFRQRKRDYIDKWKSSGCAICGEEDVVVLEAHHIEEDRKNDLLRNSAHRKLQIAELGWKAIDEELKKCIVLCANCHRRETYNRRNGKEVT